MLYRVNMHTHTSILVLASILILIEHTSTLVYSSIIRRETHYFSNLTINHIYYITLNIVIYDTLITYILPIYF